MHSILILLILIVGLIIKFVSSPNKVNKRISTWAGINLFFYAALRATTVGTDISSYAN